MREILFKAKLKDWKTNQQQNKWVKGYYLSKQETTYCFKEDYEKYPVKTLHYIAVEHTTDWGLPNEFTYYEIDPNTLCQYTGRNDSSGNKIWENDIVRKTDTNALGYHRERICTVSFDELGYWIIMTTLGDGYVLGEFEEKQLEVIGNKFDNPELLKGE